MSTTRKIYTTFRPGSGDWLIQRIEYRTDGGAWLPYDLTGLTEAQFVANRIQGTGNEQIVKTLLTGVAVQDAAAGLIGVRWDPVIPDLDAPGIYEWIWGLTFPDRGPVWVPKDRVLPLFEVLPTVL